MGDQGALSRHPGHGRLTGESGQARELLVDGRGEGERIEVRAERAQGGDTSGIGLGADTGCTPQACLRSPGS
jgi:hypothetical protein